ncbi:MAG: hypothetical protein GXP62_01390, partial [Oligoflexia bacterium]|nr:hypothetical protein [Oligoflexia bacterium]
GLRHSGASAHPRDVRGAHPRAPRSSQPDDEPDPAPAPLAPRSIVALAAAKPRPDLDSSPPPTLHQVQPQGDDTGLEHPPLLPESATLQARFHAFRRWLECGGIDRDLWAHDAILLAEHPPELHIGFRSKFNVGQAKRKKNDPRLRQGLEAYFPQCSAVKIELAEAGGQSRREADEITYQQRVQELTTELGTHPLVLELQRVLGAVLTDVVPDTTVKAVGDDELDDPEDEQT